MRLHAWFDEYTWHSIFHFLLPPPGTALNDEAVTDFFRELGRLRTVSKRMLQYVTSFLIRADDDRLKHLFMFRMLHVGPWVCLKADAQPTVVGMERIAQERCFNRACQIPRNLVIQDRRERPFLSRRHKRARCAHDTAWENDVAGVVWMDTFKVWRGRPSSLNSIDLHILREMIHSDALVFVMQEHDRAEISHSHPRS